MARTRPFVEEITEDEYRKRLRRLLEPEAFAAEPAGTVAKPSSRENNPSGVFPAEPLQLSVDKPPIKPLENSSETFVTVYLRRIGVDAAVGLLVRLFGRTPVRDAWAKSSHVPDLEKSTKHEMVWVLVETRRAAQELTVKAACEQISRRGISAEAGSKALTAASEIQRAFYSADKVVKKDPGLKEALISAVQGNLIDWRASNQSYNAFERKLLAGYKIARKSAS